MFEDAMLGFLVLAFFLLFAYMFKTFGNKTETVTI